MFHFRTIIEHVQWPNEITPPPLEIEFVRPIGQDTNIKKMSGRRIVDIQQFISNIRMLEDHQCKNNGHLSFHHEIRDGLNSILIYKCTSCCEIRKIETNPSEDEKGSPNFASAWGIIMAGKGYSSLNELFAFIDIPFMSPQTFSKYQEKVGQVKLCLSNYSYYLIRS